MNKLFDKLVDNMCTQWSYPAYKWKYPHTSAHAVREIYSRVGKYTTTHAFTWILCVHTAYSVEAQANSRVFLIYSRYLYVFSPYFCFAVFPSFFKWKWAVLHTVLCLFMMMQSFYNWHKGHVQSGCPNRAQIRFPIQIGVRLLLSSLNKAMECIQNQIWSIWM